MALAALNLQVSALADGKSAIKHIGGALPAPGLTTLLADITTALGTAGGSHDSTTELQTIQTDANALALGLSSDVSIVWNASTVTTKNQLRTALRRAMDLLDSGYGALT